MQIHDWTRVTAGTFHDFHSSWITHIKEALNLSLLPPGFYAMAERHAGRTVPYILALTSPEWTTHDQVESSGEDYVLGGHSDDAPPQELWLWLTLRRKSLFAASFPNPRSIEKSGERFRFVRNLTIVS